MANTSELKAETEVSTDAPEAAPNSRRRIVKATTPKGADGGGDGVNGTSAYAYPSPNDNDDEEGKKGKAKSYDDDADIVESFRNERLKTTEKRGKALREKQLEARRQAPVTTDIAANPFSRFLSVFSVEPKHPEHKRPWKNDDNTDSDEGPSEKKLKASESDYYGSSDGNNDDGGDSSGFLSSKVFWVASTMAVVAVGVALAMQRGRKH